MSSSERPCCFFSVAIWPKRAVADRHDADGSASVSVALHTVERDGGGGARRAPRVGRRPRLHAHSEEHDARGQASRHSADVSLHSEGRFPKTLSAAGADGAAGTLGCTPKLIHNTAPRPRRALGFAHSRVQHAAKGPDGWGAGELDDPPAQGAVAAVPRCARRARRRPQRMSHDASPVWRSGTAHSRVQHAAKGPDGQRAILAVSPRECRRR